MSEHLHENLPMLNDAHYGIGLLEGPCEFRGRLMICTAVQTALALLTESTVRGILGVYEAVKMSLPLLAESH